MRTKTVGVDAGQARENVLSTLLYAEVLSKVL